VLLIEATAIESHVPTQPQTSGSVPTPDTPFEEHLHRAMASDSKSEPVGEKVSNASTQKATSRKDGVGAENGSGRRVRKKSATKRFLGESSSRFTSRSSKALQSRSTNEQRATRRLDIHAGEIESNMLSVVADEIDSAQLTRSTEGSSAERLPPKGWGESSHGDPLDLLRLVAGEDDTATDSWQVPPQERAKRRSGGLKEGDVLELAEVAIRSETPKLARARDLPTVSTLLQEPKVAPEARGDDRPTSGARPSTAEPPELTVVDLRAARESDSGNRATIAGEQRTEREGGESEPVTRYLKAVGETTGESAGSAEESPGGFTDPGSANRRATHGMTEGGSKESPQRSEFSRLFRERTQSEILKQSTIVLRGANRGEIRMSMRPEQLGNLRIRLELDHNRIMGRIIVDSSSAREVVEQNLDDLARSFRDIGFESADLEVAVSGRGNGRGDSARERKERDDAGVDPDGSIRKQEETSRLVDAVMETTINLVV